MHEQSKATESVALTAGAKMNALCSIQDNRILHLNSIVCVHHVAVNGKAVNSNKYTGGRRQFSIDSAGRLIISERYV
jgi:hypothetical protein